MKIVPHLSISRVSSGLTAVACAGFLVNAILTDNGGTPDSQEKWRLSKAENKSIVSRFGPETYSEWKAEQKRLDDTITSSISQLERDLNQPGKPVPVRDEPSVLSLIRENADVAPSVSSGTDRVSVIVKQGDTLFAIAQRHGLKIFELARLNGLEEPYTIRIGQTLYVAR